MKAWIKQWLELLIENILALYSTCQESVQWVEILLSLLLLPLNLKSKNLKWHENKSYCLKHCFTQASYTEVSSTYRITIIGNYIQTNLPNLRVGKSVYKFICIFLYLFRHDRKLSFYSKLCILKIRISLWHFQL